MSENDFIIVDEEETNKEDNRQDTGREEEKKEVTTSDHSKKDDDGYERICFICHRPNTLDSLEYSVNETMKEIGMPQITKEQCRQFVGDACKDTLCE